MCVAEDYGLMHAREVCSTTKLYLHPFFGNIFINLCKFFNLVTGSQ